MAVPQKHKEHAPASVKCGVITVSDSRTPESDESGKLIRDLLLRSGHTVLFQVIVKDEAKQIVEALEQASWTCDAILTNGGTGLAPRDVTISALLPVFEKTLPGFGELFRSLSFKEIGSAAMMSGAIAGVYHGRLVFCLPGSPDACRLALKKLIALEEAMRIAMDLVHPIERNETVPILDALHRVSAEDVRSAIDVPLADRAAMDGYAVVARDTFPAGKFKPVTLRRIETLYAASVPRKRVASGRCTEVATGSTLPKGADAVVMVEDTEHDGDLVTIYSPVHPGEHVSGRGEDIARRSLVVREGEVLTPAKVGALAAIGMARASVYAKPRVSILTTGDEVVPPGRPIRAGQVYDINSQTIASVVRENGGEPVLLGRVLDRLEALRAALKKAIANDLVVFSGGSSVGEKDIVVDVLRSMGDLLFHGIAVKPGKPTVLGRVHGKAVLGMPGYPTSCLSNCYMILAPMLRRMARLPPAYERIVEVPLAKRVVSTIGRVEFHTVRIVDGQAVPAYKESGAITSMAHADGYIEIPANVDLLEKGETVRVTLF